MCLTRCVSTAMISLTLLWMTCLPYTRCYGVICSPSGITWRSRSTTSPCTTNKRCTIRKATRAYEFFLHFMIERCGNWKVFDVPICSTNGQPTCCTGRYDVVLCRRNVSCCIKLPTRKSSLNKRSLTRTHPKTRKRRTNPP